MGKNLTNLGIKQMIPAQPGWVAWFEGEDKDDLFESDVVAWCLFDALHDEDGTITENTPGGLVADNDGILLVEDITNFRGYQRRG